MALLSFIRPSTFQPRPGGGLEGRAYGLRQNFSISHLGRPDLRHSPARQQFSRGEPVVRTVGQTG